MHLKTSSGKWPPSCLGLNVLMLGNDTKWNHIYISPNEFMETAAKNLGNILKYHLSHSCILTHASGTMAITVLLYGSSSRSIHE